MEWVIRDGIRHKINSQGLFVNKKDLLYVFVQKVKPVDGFMDFTCHATPYHFLYDMKGTCKEKDFLRLEPEVYASMIRNSDIYDGGNIRIISCRSGAKRDGAAQRLANALGVVVKAPTETVNLDGEGNMFVSDSEALAESWFNAKVKSSIPPTGRWMDFYPEK